MLALVVSLGCSVLSVLIILFVLLVDHNERDEVSTNEQIDDVGQHRSRADLLEDE